jgi:hypothetical protein
MTMKWATGKNPVRKPRSQGLNRRPGFEETIVTDRWPLARTDGEVTHKPFLGAEDLIRNVHVRR